MQEKVSEERRLVDSKKSRRSIGRDSNGPIGRRVEPARERRRYGSRATERDGYRLLIALLPIFATKLMGAALRFNLILRNRCL